MTLAADYFDFDPALAVVCFDSCLNGPHKILEIEGGWPFSWTETCVAYRLSALNPPWRFMGSMNRIMEGFCFSLTDCRNEV